MTKVVGSGISWQKVTGHDNGDTVDLFQQRIISRHGNLSTSRAKLGIFSSYDNNKTTKRPNTAAGLDDAESLRNSNAKKCLNGLKNLGIFPDKLTQRNCVSAVDEMLDKKIITNHVRKTSNPKPTFDKLDDVECNEKIKTFKALICPQNLGTYWHNVPNGKVKQARNFSDGIEEVGSHLKFTVTAKGLNTPSRTLTEFQLTYDQDKDRARGWTKPETCQESNYETFDEVSVSPVVINHLNSIKNGQPNVIGHMSSDQQLNEFQLTCQQDRMRYTSLDDNSKTCMLDYHKSDTYGGFVQQHTRVQDSNNLGSVKTSLLKNQAKQIIKRPAANTASRDNQHFGMARSQRRSQLDYHKDSIWYHQDQDKLHQTESSPACNGKCDDSALVSEPHNQNGDPSHGALRSDHEKPSDRTFLLKRGQSPQAEQSFQQSNISQNNSSYTVPDNGQQQMKYLPSRPQSVTPISVRVNSNVEPSSLRPASQPGSDIENGASLKDQLNAIGESLSNLSSKLNCKQVSGSRSLTNQADETMPSTADSLRHDQHGGYLVHGSAEINGNMPSGVQENFIYARNFQISVSISDPSRVECKNESRSHQNSTSKPYTLESAQLSRLDSPTTLKQTNLKMCGSPKSASVSATENLSMKNKNRNNSFRADSPRQTNISNEAELALANDFLEVRCSNHKKRVTSLSDEKDTWEYFRGANMKLRVNSEVSASSSDNGDISGVEEHRREVKARDGEVAITDKESDVVSESNSLDSIDSNTCHRVKYCNTHCNTHHKFQDCNAHCRGARYENTGKSTSIKCLHSKMEESLNSTSQKTSVTEKHESKMSCPQTAAITSVCSHSPGLKSLGKTEAYTRHRISHRQKAYKEQASTLCNGEDVKQRRILTKRPPEKIPKKVIKSSVGECDRWKIERSKSAMEISLGKNNFKSSGSTLQEKKRSGSSMDTPYSSSKILKSVKSQQNPCCLKGIDNLKENISGVALEKQVHQLHQEVEERLRSKENVAHGYGRNNGSSPKTVKSREGLSDVSTINEDIIYSRLRNNNSDTTSAFVTSTPVKHIISGRHAHENNGLMLPFNPKQSNTVKSDTIDDLASVIYVCRKQNEKQVMNTVRNSDECITENSTSMRNKLTSDTTNSQTVMVGVNKSHNNLDPVSLKSLTTVTPHLKSEISQNGISHHKQHLLSKNKLTEVPNSPSTSLLEVPDLPSTSLTHHTPSDNLQFFTVMSRFARNGERSSPVELLLSHLDNPSVVQLMQKLYKADYETRQIIMIKVEFFKAWHNYTLSSRKHRARKDILTQKSIRSCAHRLLSSHFSMWHFRASHSRNMRQANALYRSHVLTKGLKALRWSVSQSKHLLMKLQSRVYALRLKASFEKWKITVEKQRRQCLGNAVEQWRQYVCETQKIRHMRQVLECRIVMDVLHQWRKCYNKRLKKNMAFSYLRETFLRHAFTLWQAHFSQCKEKKEMYSLAELHHHCMLLKSGLHIMVASFTKAQKAATHLRCHQVCKVFFAWKNVIGVCLVERQEEMAVSMEHWQKQTMRQSFTNWREKLVINRVARKADFTICRTTFLVWRQAWKTNVAHYQAIEAAVTRNKLHHVILAWRENVEQQQRRQKMAVALIESCYLTHVLNAWKMYISTKVILRRKTQLHRVVVQHKILISCFSQWQQSHKHHQQEKLTRQLWSEGCARKMAFQWKLICYRRSLIRLFEVTQPEREKRLMRGMFVHWMSSLSRRRREMEQAEDLYKVVQWHHLLFVFTFWKAETQRALTIKPLVQRLENHILEKCFLGWKDFILQKSKCKQSQRICLKKILSMSFHSWRRQHQACLIGKRIKNRMSQGLLLVFFNEWWFLIHRKWKGHHFNILRLMHQTFSCWRNRAINLYTHREEMKKEEETNLNLKRKCFTTWLEYMQVQVSWTEQCVGQFVQKQDKSVLLRAIIFWKQHMQSSLISRTYQRNQSQRLLLTLFLAWQELTNVSVSEAVLHFSERIGLTNELQIFEKSTIKMGYLESTVQEKETNTTFGSLRSSCPSLQSLASEADRSRETDADRMLLFTGGLQDFVVDHRAKCHRIKETVQAIIHRLMHWPVCVAFEQWKEFTAREHSMKAAFNQLQTLHLTVETSLAFRDWRSKFFIAKTAQDHRNAHILSGSLRGLRWYKDHRKFIKRQSTLAWQYYRLAVLRKFFPPWLHKTQVQINDKHILHLWTGCTAREIELNPLENYLAHKLDQQLLLACFSVWLVKYQAVVRIKIVYQGYLLRWVFSSWQAWAKEKHDQVVKSLNMNNKRRTEMAFGLWARKLHQVKETDRRYRETWHNYLLLIVQRWCLWARSSHKLHLLQKLFELQQSQRSLLSYFCHWKSLAVKVKEFRINQTQRITYSVFSGWRSAVKNIINDKQKIFQCQILSNIFLTKRLLHKWYSDYTKLKILQWKRKQYAEQCAISAGILWRKKAQKTRGQKLEVVFLRRKIFSYMQHWKASLSNLQCMYGTLVSWNQRRNVSMLSQHFKNWKTQLIADQARKVHTCRFVCTIMAEWLYFARMNKERYKQGLSLRKALQDKSLIASFQYWMAVTKVKRSIQQNVETRLQIRVLRSWKLYTCKMCSLRELQTQFTHHVTTRILCHAFMNMQRQAEYCTSLQEMAEQVVKDREKTLMRALFTAWINKLNKIGAAQYYEQILAVRGMRQWQRFINKRKQTHLKEKEDWKIAMDHHRHSVCKKVFAALRLEVRVSDLVARRKQNQCFKYARIWKFKVDMQNTATILGCEFVQRHAWNKWRMEQTKITSTKQVTKLLQNHLLCQVFTAWRGLCKSINSKAKPQPILNSGSKANTQLLSLTSASVLSSLSSRSSPTISAGNMSFGFKSGYRVQQT